MIAFHEKRNPRIELIGTGGRGTTLLRKRIEQMRRWLALCDIVKEKAEHAAEVVVNTDRRSLPSTRWDHAFESMLGCVNDTCVIVATHWGWHAEMESAMSTAKMLRLKPAAFMEGGA